MTVYVLLADGFEECEAIAPTDILRRAGAEVKTASISQSLDVAGAHGINVKADMLADEIQPSDIQMLILPGGGEGTRRLGESPKVLSLIQYCADSGIYIGAICAAPSILGKMGLLAGRRAVCYPSFQPTLTDAVITRTKVERDDIYITGLGAGAAYDFGFALVEALYGTEASDSLKTSMLY